MAVAPGSKARPCPSQLTHLLRFLVRFRVPRSAEEVAGSLAREPLLAWTAKFDSQRVFELGRRYGVQGRIYAHAVVVVHDLLVKGREVRGWAFVPQEGNTLLSTLGAFLLQTGHPEAEGVFGELREQLVVREW